MRPFKVAIVGGGGMVGATTAYAMTLAGLPAEIALVDVAELAATGQALDISDASVAFPAQVHQGDFKEAGQADLTIITAGYPQKPGETRAQLLQKNREIMTSIINSMQPIRPDLKILVIANPVDVLTACVQHVSGLPKSQVFGSGTHLDSSRLENELGKITGVHASGIRAHVLGEHGDRQFVAWSAAQAGGEPLLAHPAMKGKNLNEIVDNVRDKAYKIIEAKRSTYFGIGRCATEIVSSALYGTNQVFPLSIYNEDYGVYMSWPCTLGNSGVEQIFNPDLNADEKQKLQTAVSAIKEMNREIGIAN